MTAQAQEILEANIAYHTALAETYDVEQPHYKAENVERVDHVFRRLAEETGGGSLLDLGCGTGFVINIAKKYFRRVVGVDITREMMDRVDRSNGQIELYLADTAELPLDDDQFDVCTASSFLHHLHSLAPTLREAHRCLRPGGIFYSDQDPNRHYWLLMEQLQSRGDVRGSVQREIRSVLSVSDDVAEEKGLSEEVVALAEYQKIKFKGLDPDDVLQIFSDVGFESARCQFEWFLGQGPVMHQQSVETARIVDQYLRDHLPATRHLFKYLAFFASK